MDKENNWKIQELKEKLDAVGYGFLRQEKRHQETKEKDSQES